MRGFIETLRRLARWDTSDEAMQVGSLFPNASKSFLKLNGGLPPDSEAPRPVVERKKRKYWTIDDVSRVIFYYRNTDRTQFDITVLAAELGRTEAAIFCKADELGLTQTRGEAASVKSVVTRAAFSVAQKKRASTAEFKEESSRRMKDWHATHDHPKGMLGKHHGQDTKERISIGHLGKKQGREQILKRMKTNLLKYGHVAPHRKGGSWKSAWVEIGGKRFFARSLWEANYGRYLEWLKTHGHVVDWEHEPKTFWFPKIKRGVMSYLPDFRVVRAPSVEEYHEVKGWMDARSITKIKRMAKYHPKVKLVVIDKKSYRALARQLSHIVPGWVTSKF